MSVTRWQFGSPGCGKTTLPVHLPNFEDMPIQNLTNPSSIRIATPGVTTPDQTLANLTAALPAAVNLIPGGWENVLSVGIKTSSSVLLPVWSAALGGRFAEGAKADMDVEIEEAEEEPELKRKVPKKAEAVKATATKAPKEETKKAKETSTPKKKSSTIGSGAKSAAKTAAVGASAAKPKKATKAK